MTKNEAIKVLENTPIAPTDGYSFNDISDALCIAVEALLDSPKGEWNDIGGVIRWGCSLCHYAYDQKFNFCPNCGSDNRERSEE